MHLLQPSGTSVVIVAVFTAALCQGAHGQGTPAPAAQSKTAPAIEAARLPPRATAAEYQARAQAGAVTIGAEFTAHSVATLQATLATEDYVVVEVGLFGQPDARLKLSHEDFSLRVNGKKALLLAQPYLLVFKSLKDPEWEPPASKAKKDSSDAETPKSSDRNPVFVRIPFDVERTMQVRVQKAALPEGDRALPEAGLIFFQYGGRTNGIHSVELIYTGPAGQATLPLHP
jgi:hypothetical protein